tara:strand:- start:6760 stop:6945 length:186 start_codon:yes stop_codon:yes gene_type:complete
MIIALLTRAIGTMAAKQLIIMLLRALVNRTDNKIDDALLAVVAEVLEGDTSSIKAKALKKK